MKPDQPAHGRRRASWKVVFLVGLVMVIGVLVINVFPYRSYLSQHKQQAVAAHQLATIEKQNRDLAEQAKRLQTPAEIERLARAQYGMVRPGETSYAILPAPVGPLRLPELWPYQN